MFSSKRKLFEKKDLNEENKPLLSSSNENSIEQYDDQKQLTALSILLYIANTKEILVLLPAICKTFYQKSKEQKQKSEEYNFKVQQLAAKCFVNRSMKLNLNKLQEIEKFLARLPLGYAGIPKKLSEKYERVGDAKTVRKFNSFLILKEEKASVDLSQEKIKKFKDTYRRFFAELPSKLDDYKNGYRKSTAGNAFGTMFWQCLPPSWSLLFFAPVWVKILCVSSLLPGGVICCIGECELPEKISEIHDSLAQIEELSGFDFIEKFTLEKFRIENKMQIKKELIELEKFEVVSNFKAKI